jgi:hypothetical protein
MISYDDLVGALAAWRARQGLPVVQVAGAPAPARPAPAPARSTPPAAPPRAASRPPGPDPDYAESALEETPYDASDDYVVALGVEPGESTAIGDAPEPVTEGLLVPKAGKRNQPW